MVYFTRLKELPQFEVLCFLLVFTLPSFGHANSHIEFVDFSFVEIAGSPVHEGLMPIPGQPIKGSLAQGMAILAGEFASAQFRLVSEFGESISDLNLPAFSTNTVFTRFVGSIEMPNLPFRVAARGMDKDGFSYDLVFPTLFNPVSLEIRIEPPTRPLYPGSVLVFGQVTNFGVDGTFNINVTNDNRVPSTVNPTSLSLSKLETGMFQVELSVPRDLSEESVVTVIATVNRSSNPADNNSEVAPLFIGLRDATLGTLEIDKAKAVPGLQGRFEIKGVFTPSAGNNGFNPITEVVTVRLGAYEESIPTGSFFRTDRNDGYLYLSHSKLGISKILVLDTGKFDVTARNVFLDERDLSRPMYFSFQAGADLGETSLLMR